MAITLHRLDGSVVSVDPTQVQAVNDMPAADAVPAQAAIPAVAEHAQILVNRQYIEVKETVDQVQNLIAGANPVPQR